MLILIDIHTIGFKSIYVFIYSYLIPMCRTEFGKMSPIYAGIKYRC